MKQKLIQTITTIQNLKEKEELILILLYQFRFLNTKQLQLLLNHKYKKKITDWLNNLSELGYIHRFYDKRFAGVAAVYCLATKSRKYLKETGEKQGMTIHSVKIKEVLLDRIYREKTLSQTFQKHSTFIANIYLSLLSLTANTKATLHFYTKTDLYGMKHLITPHPDVYFAIQEVNGKTKRYFLDVFDELPARMVMRRRIKQYFRYYQDNYWQEYNKNPFPEIIIIIPDQRSKNYVNRFIKKMRKDELVDLQFYLSTWEIQQKGMNKQVLEKVE